MMIKFEKDVAKLLPYNRRQYQVFFDDELEELQPSVPWYGISMQIENIRNEKLYAVPDETVKQSIDLLEAAFRTIISKQDQGLPWIVSHDNIDLNWFLKDDGKLPAWRKLFKDHGVPNDYRGGIVFLKNDLLDLAREVVMYPYAFSHMNLDVSHSKLQLIVKTTGHLTIDVLSTDKKLLNEIVSDDSFGHFLKIPYRGR